MPRHTYLCPLRWADMDPFGHVNNTQFVAYLEQARVDLLFHHATEVGVPTMAGGMVVARHEIDYLRPVVYRHLPLLVEMWCSKLAGASFTVHYEIFDAAGDGAVDGAVTGAVTGAASVGAPDAATVTSGVTVGAGRPPTEAGDGGPAEATERVLAARASSLLVPYDLAAGRPRRLTPQEREFLRRFEEERVA